MDFLSVWGGFVPNIRRGALGHLDGPDAAIEMPHLDPAATSWLFPHEQVLGRWAGRPNLVAVCVNVTSLRRRLDELTTMAAHLVIATETRVNEELRDHLERRAMAKGWVIVWSQPSRMAPTSRGHALPAPTGVAILARSALGVSTLTLPSEADDFVEEARPAVAMIHLPDGSYFTVLGAYARAGRLASDRQFNERLWNWTASWLPTSSSPLWMLALWKTRPATGPKSENY